MEKLRTTRTSLSTVLKLCGKILTDDGKDTRQVKGAHVIAQQNLHFLTAYPEQILIIYSSEFLPADWNEPPENFYALLMLISGFSES